MNKDMLSKFLYTLILLLCFVGLYGTFGLVRNEYLNGDVCPKILSIPACYIIFICFAAALISHLNLIKDGSILFWIGVLPALSIASYGSLGELVGFASCPKTSGGIPMCFISFGFFGSLALLKLLLRRSNH